MTIKIMDKTQTQAQDEPQVNAEAQQKAIESIIVSRVGLLINNPFWGNIASRLILVPDPGNWCKTAATDGRHIFFSSEFVNKLKPKEVTFLVGHEVLHAVYDHVGDFSRLNGRNVKLFNVACDFVVNQDLVEYKIGERITTVPVLYDKKYNGMIAEEVYEDLFKNAKKVSIEDLEKLLLDDHLDTDGSGDGDGDDDGRPRLSAEERQQIKDELKESLLSAAQSVGVGNVPMGIRRMLKDLTEPQMDWKQILQQQIESQVKNDFTYMRPSRRGWSCDAILPSMKHEPAVEAFVTMDMSGSISDKEIKVFMSELIGIMQQHQSFKIGVCTFDTKVYNYQEYTEDNFEEIYNYEIMGGGGTDFGCVFKFLEENEIETKQIVFLTDGECYNWGNPDLAPTLWLIKNNHNKGIVAPFGTTIYMED
jgi:predicted metal-dependent peptidase